MRLSYAYSNAVASCSVYAPIIAPADTAISKIRTSTIKGMNSFFPSAIILDPKILRQTNFDINKNNLHQECEVIEKSDTEVEWCELKSA